MKFKRVAETYGAAITWHSATRTLLLVIGLWAWSVHFPKIGACKQCGHGWNLHLARRDKSAIQWHCLFKGALGKSCECEHYNPIVKGQA